MSTNKLCIQCGSPLDPSAKYCDECGAKQVENCEKCGAELSPAARFCGECGARIESRHPSTLPLVEHIDIAPSPLGLAACTIHDLSFEAEGPDSDGDLRFTIQYTLANDTEFEIARVDSTAQLLTASGLPIKETADSSEVTVLPGASERLQLSFWAKRNALGDTLHKSHILVSLTASRVIMQDLGPLRIPATPYDPVCIPSATVGDRLKSFSSAIWLEAIDDDGYCGITATALTQNLTSHNFPEARLVIDIDRGGDLGNAEVSGSAEIRAGAISMIEASGGDEASAIRGCAARAKLALYEAVAYAVAQRTDLKTRQSDAKSDDSAGHDDQQFADSSGVCEVIVTDVNNDEYVYWVKNEDLDNQDDVEDESIAAAVAFHKSTVGSEVAIDENDVEQAYACEPFSRLPGEFTWVDMSTINRPSSS